MFTRNAANNGTTTPTTLSEILNNNLRFNGNPTDGGRSIGQAVRAVGVDLDDLGIAEGDSLTAFGLSGANADPVIIAGLPIPEPGTSLLVLLSLLPLLRRKRA